MTTALAWAKPRDRHSATGFYRFFETDLFAAIPPEPAFSVGGGIGWAGALQRRQIGKNGGRSPGGLTPGPGTITRTAAFSTDIQRELCMRDSQDRRGSLSGGSRRLVVGCLLTVFAAPLLGP